MKTRKNMVGERYGKLVVMEFVGEIPNAGKSKKWKCRCDCGNVCYVTRCHLVSKRIVSCGCFRKEQVTKALKKDLIGKKFGRLQVIELSHVDKKRGYFWKCKCACGRDTIVKGSRLLTGHTKSCGCLCRELASKHIKELIKIQVGDKNPNWNPNISDEQRKLKNTYIGKESLMAVWRGSVYERDKYTCQKCKNLKGGNLNAHHIFSRNSHPTLIYDIDNGITLCKDCHKKFHQYFGWGDNDRKQLDEFLNGFPNT